MKFQPDTIAVEGAWHQQEIISKSYQELSLSDLKNPKMRNTPYEICMFGEKNLITCDNEAIQVGYKMGKLLNLNDIHAIDVDMSLGSNVEKIIPFTSVQWQRSIS